MRGYAQCADAFHPSSPNPSGEWEALVMRNAQREAGIGPADVSGVYAHGTGTPKGDLAEIRALNDVFAERIATLPVTSLKGHMGHPGSSASAMNLVAATIGMRRGEILPTARPSTPIPRSSSTSCWSARRRSTCTAIQLNAFGFGGQNASMVITPASRPFPVTPRPQPCMVRPHVRADVTAVASPSNRAVVSREGAVMTAPTTAGRPREPGPRRR